LVSAAALLAQMKPRSLASLGMAIIILRSGHFRAAIAILASPRIESTIQYGGFLRGTLKQISALYPGSFDPPTNGHLDLIERGAKIFDELIVGILRNSEKVPMFSLPERLEMLKTLTAHLKNVRIEAFHGLMVEYAKSIEATCVLRGIRAVSDYEYELQMALMNRKLEPTLETVFMMPADKYSYVSSRLVREVAQAGGPVRGLVPEVVEQRLREKLEPAYRFHDELQEDLAQTAEINSQERERLRKKKS
jgi:pantetheine-phosphate adenylyltransferase